MNLKEIEKMSDENIVDLVFQDKEFFGVIIRRYEGRLLKYVGRITSGDSDFIEDIVQNIFIKAYVNINSFKKGKKFGSWLYGIAHNECVDNWRKYKKHSCNVSLEGNEELFVKIASGEDMEKMIFDKNVCENVGKALEKLPLKFKEVLILKYLEDKSYEEISDILRKPPSTVGTLLNRAKKRFKKILIEKK